MIVCLITEHTDWSIHLILLGGKMHMKINQAGRWERICRSVYQKVDLHFEAKNAQKHCKRQLATINGGLRGDKREFE